MDLCASSFKSKHCRCISPQANSTWTILHQTIQDPDRAKITGTFVVQCRHGHVLVLVVWNWQRQDWTRHNSDFSHALVQKANASIVSSKNCRCCSIACSSGTPFVLGLTRLTRQTSSTRANAKCIIVHHHITVSPCCHMWPSLTLPVCKEELFAWCSKSESSQFGAIGNLETRSGRVSENFMQVGKPPEGKSYQIITGCVKHQFMHIPTGACKTPRTMQMSNVWWVCDVSIISPFSLLDIPQPVRATGTPSRLIKYQRRCLCISASKTLKYRPKASSTSEYKMESSAGWMETTCSSAMLPKLHKSGWCWRKQSFTMTPVTWMHISYICHCNYHSTIIWFINCCLLSEDGKIWQMSLALFFSFRARPSTTTRKAGIKSIPLNVRCRRSKNDFEEPPVLLASAGQVPICPCAPTYMYILNAKRWTWYAHSNTLKNVHAPNGCKKQPA